jgi:outer membrane protein OmpA-like peptidoglycan-associated protein
MDNPFRRTGSARRPGLALRGPLPFIALVSAVAVASPVSGQGLRLRVAPEATTVRWDDALGLQNATFFGGGLALDFGRYVTLRGTYGTAGTVGTAFARADFAADDGSPLEENQVKTSLFSTSVLFRLGARRVAPLLGVRGGVLYLEPDGRSSARQIVGAYGGGMSLRLTPWMDGQVLLERSSLRLDRALLAGPDAAAATDADYDATRSNVALSAALGLRVGSGRSSGRADDVDRDFDQLLSGSTEGLLVPVEVQGGVLRFADALGLQDQRLMSVRSGVDLGPYFGLRGQYWRGVTDAFDAFRGMSGWSGEFQFNVGRVTGASPHLVLGLGQTRFDQDFRDETGTSLENFNTLILGAGLGIPVDDRARLTVSLRDHVSTARGLDQTSSTADLRHSLSLTAGISFLVVGHRAVPAPVMRAEATQDSADYRSSQVLSIPLPKEGELYVRYGPGGRTLPDGGTPPGTAPGVDSVAVRAAITGELTRLLAGGGAALSDSARAELEGRVMERLQALPASGPGDSARVAGGATGDSLAPVAGGGDPQLEDLRKQVADLTQLVREGMLLQAAGGILRGGGTTVNVNPGGEGVGEGTEGQEPFLRALEGRLGLGNMGAGNRGVTFRTDAYLSALRGDDNLIPFATLEFARNGITAEKDGQPVRGSTRTLGAGFGVVAVLPHAGPFWPTAGVLFSAARVGTSGDRPEADATIDDLYGGLTLGPGIQIGAAYRPTPASRSFLAVALRKIWSGRTSRWSFETGMRLTFPPRSSRGPVGPFAAQGVPPMAPVAADTVALPAPDTAAVAQADTRNAELLARVEALEVQLREQSSARARAEAEARSAQGTVDSLSAVARQQAAARTEMVQALDRLASGSDPVMRVDEVEEGVRVILAGDFFQVGATSLEDAARDDVLALAAILAPRTDLPVHVEGHTDSSGTDEANLVISRLRAQAVADALVEGGVGAGRVTTLGKGAALPVADNDTREGRAENRRVEILIRLRR